MDAIAGLLDLAPAGAQLAVVAHFHETARRHLRPVQPERDLVIAFAAGNPERQMIEDPLVELVHHREPVSRGEIDPRLPSRRADVAALDRIRF